MARRSSHRSALALSPLHPSLHFLLFLALAFILVAIVAVVMQQTAKNTRAALFCPQSQMDQTELIQELSGRCPQGVTYTKDTNNCGVWICKTAATQ